MLFYYSAPLLATSSPFASNPGRPMLCRCGRWHDLSSCHGLMAVQQGFVCNSYKYGSALVRSETPPCSGQPNTNQQICLEGMCCRLPQRANQTMFPSSSHISGITKWSQSKCRTKLEAHADVYASFHPSSRTTNGAFRRHGSRT